MTDDTWTGNLLAVGHGCHEPRSGLDGQARAFHGSLGDEAVHGPRVQQGNECGVAQGDLDLHGIAHGHPGHRVQRENWILSLIRLLVPDVGLIVVLHLVVQEEELFTDLVMPTTVILVTIVAQPQLATLHLGLVQAANPTTVDQRNRSHWFGRDRVGRNARTAVRQHSFARRPSHGCVVLVQVLHLAREAHGGCQ